MHQYVCRLMIKCYVLYERNSCIVFLFLSSNLKCNLWTSLNNFETWQVAFIVHYNNIGNACFLILHEYISNYIDAPYVLPDLCGH